MLRGFRDQKSILVKSLVGSWGRECLNRAPEDGAELGE